MRTSNKILLGIFTGPLIIITLIQLTLFAKYKTGNYIAMKTVQEDRFMHYAPKNINHIAVYGLNNFRIISSDTLKLEIEKNKEGHLHYIISGDSLIIHGDSVRTGAADNEIMRSYEDVNLYSPSLAGILVDNSDLVLEGTKDTLKAKSFHFDVINSASIKVDDRGDDSSHTYFKEITIKAFHSSGIELTARSRVNDFQLSMIESSFQDNGASIDKLTIDADKLSNISLKGDNLRKLNIVK